MLPTGIPSSWFWGDSSAHAATHGAGEGEEEGRKGGERARLRPPPRPLRGAEARVSPGPALANPQPIGTNLGCATPSAANRRGSSAAWRGAPHSSEPEVRAGYSDPQCLQAARLRHGDLGGRSRAHRWQVSDARGEVRRSTVLTPGGAES